MASSSAQHTEETQKSIEDLTLIAEPPKVAIEVDKIEFKSNNYLVTFQLPAERGYLNEAVREIYCNCIEVRG